MATLMLQIYLMDYWLSALDVVGSHGLALQWADKSLCGCFVKWQLHFNNMNAVYNKLFSSCVALILVFLYLPLCTISALIVFGLHFVGKLHSKTIHCNIEGRGLFLCAIKAIKCLYLIKLKYSTSFKTFVFIFFLNYIPVKCNLPIKVIIYS